MGFCPNLDGIRQELWRIDDVRVCTSISPRVQSLTLVMKHTGIPGGGRGEFESHLCLTLLMVAVRSPVCSLG